MSTYARVLGRLGDNRDLYPEGVLNLIGITPPRFGEGPGARVTVFTQGCPRFCPGCRNLEAIQIRVGTPTPIEDFVRHIARWQRIKLPTTRYDAPTAYLKLLRANLLTSLIWECSTAPRAEAELSGVRLPELSRMIRDVHERLKPLAFSDFGAPDLPEAWPSIPVQGVTFSGGEPAVQAPAIVAATALIRERLPTWDVWVYSGMFFEELLERPATRALMAAVDAVKCGAFRWEKRERSHLFYGSANQFAVDAPASLAAGAPVPFDYPREVAACLELSDHLAAEGLDPVPTPYAVERFRAFVATSEDISTIDDFERHFDVIDDGLHERYFELRPRHRRIERQRFLRRAELNVRRFGVFAREIVEGGAAVITLQGSNFPPAADQPAMMTDIRPQTVVEAPDLLERVLTEHRRTFRTERPADEALDLWINLALQMRFFRNQRAFFLRRSPRPDVPLDIYTNVVRCWLRQLKRLFDARGRSGWRLPVHAVYVRGGDPLLQPSGVAALFRAARQRGLETWMEAPYPYDQIRQRTAEPEIADLLATCDVVVAGQPHSGAEPWVHPFLSNRRQHVMRVATGEPWSPRHPWSQQIADFTARYQTDAAIARTRLPAKVVQHFAMSERTFPTVEALEAALGPVRRPWRRRGGTR